MNAKREYEDDAKTVVEAIKALAKNEAALDNFEYYLSRHFAAWLEKFANTPGGMASELNSFAHINDHEETNG